MKTTEFIFKRTGIPLLHKAMNAYTLRQRSIASNIANATSPGYKRTEVSFENDLKKALDKNGVRGKMTDIRHIPLGRSPIEKLKPEIFVPDDGSLASGLNNVNIEQEMANQAKNSLNFSFSSRLASGQFTNLRSAIRGENLRR